MYVCMYVCMCVGVCMCVHVFYFLLHCAIVYGQGESGRIQHRHAPGVGGFAENSSHGQKEQFEKGAIFTHCVSHRRAIVG